LAIIFSSTAHPNERQIKRQGAKVKRQTISCHPERSEGSPQFVHPAKNLPRISASVFVVGANNKLRRILRFAQDDIEDCLTLPPEM
jgi:hypothetical protein